MKCYLFTNSTYIPNDDDYNTFDWILSNPNWKDDRIASGYEFADPLLKGNDDMGHFIIGLNPQYHINSSISVNANIAFVGLLQQSYVVDRSTNVAVEGVQNIVNASVGISYRLGQ